MRDLSAAIIATLVSFQSHHHVNGKSVTSRFQVHFPPTLSKKKGYDHRQASFGIPSYGASLQQNVFYADSDLCNPAVNNHAGYPTRGKQKDGQMLPWTAPFILMVDRGGCTFVQKVRNAQRVGAAGVLIADNSCLCISGSDCISDPGQACETREPILADDGSGADITIPSFLLYKQDADPIKAELMANHMVLVEMSWSLPPSPDARVEYELWSTPTDLVSNEFRQQFKAAAVALGNRAYFTPHTYILDGIKTGCHSRSSNECFNLCTNNGRYCSTDPDNDLDKGISGADVVKESLRRECIWKHYGEQDGIGAPWWNYVEEFMFRCNNALYFANEDCVKDAMAHADVSYGTIEQCIEDSGGISENAQNAILEMQILEKQNAGIVRFPTVLVNGVSLRESVEFSTVFGAICARYAKGSGPDVCKKCATCPQVLECVNKFNNNTAIQDPCATHVVIEKQVHSEEGNICKRFASCSQEMLANLTQPIGQEQQIVENNSTQPAVIARQKPKYAGCNDPTNTSCILPNTRRLSEENSGKTGFRNLVVLMSFMIVAFVGVEAWQNHQKWST